MLKRCLCTTSVTCAYQSVQFAGRRYEVLWICSKYVPLTARKIASEITVLAWFVSLQRLLLFLVACSDSQGIRAVLCSDRTNLFSHWCMIHSAKGRVGGINKLRLGFTYRVIKELALVPRKAILQCG